MSTRAKKRLVGASGAVLLGMVLTGCNGSTTTPNPAEETTASTVTETTTTTVAPTTTTTTLPTTTTTVAPTTTTTLAPSEDPDHPFYDPYAGMDAPSSMWPVAFGDFEEAMDLLMGGMAQGGVVPKRGCDTAPLGSPCYEVERHTHVDGKYHVVLISINVDVGQDRDERHFYVEVRSEDPSTTGTGWRVDKEKFAQTGYVPPPVWAR